MALVGQGGNSYVLARVEDGQVRLYTWEAGTWHKGEEIAFPSPVREVTATYTQGVLLLLGIDTGGEVYLGSRKGKVDPLPLRLPVHASPHLLAGAKGLHLFFTDEGNRRHLPLTDGTFPTPRLVARSGPWAETVTVGGEILLVYEEGNGEISYRDWQPDGAAWTSASRLPALPGAVEGIGLLHADGASYLLAQVQRPSGTGLYLISRNAKGWQGWLEVATARGLCRPNLLLQGNTVVVSWQAEGTVQRRWSGDRGRHLGPVQSIVRQEVPLLPLESAPPEQEVQALAVYGGPPPRLLGNLANWLRPMPEKGVPPAVIPTETAPEDLANERIHRLEADLQELRQHLSRAKEEGRKPASHSFRAPGTRRQGLSWRQQLAQLSNQSETQRKKLEAFEQSATHMTRSWEGSHGQLERLLATLLGTSKREDEERKYLILQSRELAKRLDQWESRGNAILENHSSLQKEWLAFQQRMEAELADPTMPPQTGLRSKEQATPPAEIPPPQEANGLPPRAEADAAPAPPRPTMPATPRSREPATASAMPEMRGAGLPGNPEPLFQKARWRSRNT